MAANWIEQQSLALANDGVAFQRLAQKHVDDQDRLIFYAELMVKSLHRIEWLQYQKAGVEMEDIE